MMNDAIKIQLSAFVDGELPENESELLVRRLGQDIALRHQVAGYMQLGRLLRGERELARMSQLRGRIAAALGEDIPAEVPAVEFVPSRFFRPVAGVAIAASVAVAALIGLRTVGGNNEAEFAAGNAEFAAVAIDDSSMYTEQLSSEFVTDGPSDMLMKYYLHHEERSAGSGANILTRLVTLELREGKLVQIEPRVDDSPDDAFAAGESSSDSAPATGN